MIVSFLDKAEAIVQVFVGFFERPSANTDLYAPILEPKNTTCHKNWNDHCNFFAFPCKNKLLFIYKINFVVMKCLAWRWWRSSPLKPYFFFFCCYKKLFFPHLRFETFALFHLPRVLILCRFCLPLQDSVGTKSSICFPFLIT